jgi:putative 4-mercaptohistidine N1-methyltranferase
MADDYYESDRLVAEYLLFHYGSAEDCLPYTYGPREALGLPVRVVRECVDCSALTPSSRALDVGCAVGRSSFELARFCGEVIGLDYSQAFIEAANRLAQGESMTYRIHEEGAHYREATADAPAGVDVPRLRFLHGDACALPENLGSFDVVLASNLICRLPRPRTFTDRLAGLVKPGGQLIITTPCTWLEDFTPREHWLGGPDSTTLDGLKVALEADFRLITTRDMPFLIREHARKFQWSIAQASVWERR